MVNYWFFFTVAQRVVQKSPLKVSGCELKILPFIVEPMVRVSGISRSISDEMLELFFESPKKSGGGDIKKIDKYPASDMVIITFDEEEGSLLVFSVVSGTRDVLFTNVNRTSLLAPCLPTIPEFTSFASVHGSSGSQSTWKTLKNYSLSGNIYVTFKIIKNT